MIELLTWLADRPGRQGAVHAVPVSSHHQLHLVGLAVLVGTAAAFDLRLLGLGGRTVAVSTVAGYLMQIARTRAVATAATGPVLFIASGASVATSTAALTKPVLLIVAAADVVVFHLRIYRSVGAWDDTVSAPSSARLAAGISLLAWTGVIICGRFIAYL